MPQTNHQKIVLPAVREFTQHRARCSPPTSLKVGVVDDRIARAARRWLDSLAVTGPGASLVIVEDRANLPHPDGYRILVEPDRIVLRGASAAGCFHGLQTLTQLAEGGGGIPCCEIADWPDFAVRGLLHDTTRGKVPTLATLKLLADRLASLKANQLQLYIEHSFTFAFDPQIASEQNALTPDEIRELDAYCRERFVTLVPAVATIGHMGRILSLPRYRHLAEAAPEVSWEELPWPQRARGFTLDILNPESHVLVEQIWTEILDAFSSPVVNICGDEPWDLAKGRNRERINPERIGSAYIDHILRTHEICARRGRRTQVWSDVVTKHPEEFHRLPRDLSILHWGYDDKSDYEGTRRFVDAGLDTICCPGTTGWKRVINAMDLSERNISTFARAGKECGATGLLNTDWGDHGHFNALACSWHAIALGAACAWRADHPIADDFDRRFANWLSTSIPANLEVGPHSQTTQWIARVQCEAKRFHSLVGSRRGEDQDLPLGNVVELLRRTSAIGERCETWRLLWQPIAQMAADATLPNPAELDAAAQSADAALQILNPLPAVNDVNELHTALLATQLFVARSRLARGEFRAAPEVLELLRAVAGRFASEWTARNKPSGLSDILTALDRVGSELELAAS